MGPPPPFIKKVVKSSCSGCWALAAYCFDNQFIQKAFGNLLGAGFNYFFGLIVVGFYATITQNSRVLYPNTGFYA
jgi:hypothetical protein